MTPTLIPLSLLTKAYRLGNDNRVYGAGTTGLARFKVGTTQVENLRGPNGTYLFEDNPFDMNAAGQVVCDQRRSASGNIPLHRTIVLWQNGASEYLEDILVNPGVLPVGESMRGLGINDAGQIATSIQMPDGRYHLFRFDPVPEPGTWLAMGAGLAAIMRRRRR